ncbi:hypothetical protein F5I97DRAFT_1855575 [Phlebopus sp. FC_14]|nr:hypothetical protein F5I97DRAFT_1855575 [Phlebopus sp. FC_14]
MAEVATAVRTVPGAPPSITPSKSQKRKRKINSKSKTPESPAEGSVAAPDGGFEALADRTPECDNVKENVVSAELVAASEAPTTDDAFSKPSPIVELLQKRTKAVNKKVSRISGYTSIDYEKLNEDQKKTLKSLPSLEAVQRELEEVKKTIEAHEAELFREQALKRAEAERAEALKVSEAISSTEALYTARTSFLLTLLRLRTHLVNGTLPISISFDEAEGSAIVTASDTLLGEEGDTKQEIISGLLSGRGELNGVPYIRLLDVVQLFLNPPREPTPLPAEPEPSLEPTTNGIHDEPVAGIPGALSVSSGFHFMQASELETPALEDHTEWVEKSGVQADGFPEEQANGNQEPAELVEAVSVQPLDWAEAEGGLPPIRDLQASFEPSGSATPVQNIEVNLPIPAPVNDADAPAAQQEGDGFMPTHRGSRGRGRGHRGDRGNMRGGFRGERGGFRGGDRGSYRGRGGDRGGWFFSSCGHGRLR